ncbi:MAG: DNA mismatch repair protein MutS [Flavobacteriales bacterium]|nr:DNA mismatch repair protein MutS [Flavobacteriales bacterium]
MYFFDEQTAKDLEFDEIRKLIVNACQNPTAKERMSQLSPFGSIEEASHSIEQSHELLSIRRLGLRFPRLEFSELLKEIRLLGIKSSSLDIEGVVRIYDATRMVNDLLLFFKIEEEYPLLKSLVKQAHYTKDISKAIEKVLDKSMQIKDDASEDLLYIRNRIKSVKKQVNKNFEKAVRQAKSQGFVTDISENVIDNRRVLTIVSTFKRQVDGNIMGSSKTGSLSYIEPRANEMLNKELDQLIDDERIEVRRIIKELTDYLRAYLPLIESYQSILCKLDEIMAKVKFAERIKANKPKINIKNQDTFLHEAFHPLLYLTNNGLQKTTKSQSFNLDSSRRIIVISGPNAGGKSITLKTMGLLQMMFQSGLLVSASPKSSFAWFDYILSDIGDNQSIENQLSTYSYRLQRMKFFLGKTSPKTLLLLDEFGTGSDPELGGALAEVFFETIYRKGCYGVVTTHYSNIKLRAAKLEEAVNANMLFNKETLEPEFELEIGQPGSSFTFEVAEMNGIPRPILNAAKNKINRKKLDLDQLIADLQKDKSAVYHLKTDLEHAQKQAEEAKESFKAKQKQYETRLETQQKLIESNNKYLNHGKKMEQFIASFEMKAKGKNQDLFAEIRKYISIEKTKILDAERIRLEKEKELERQRKAPKNRKYKAKATEQPIVIGSRVKLKTTKQIGEVLALEGEEATVAFGVFKTKVSLSKLVFIDGVVKKRTKK